MDRNILTTGEQFDASDICQTNKNAYIALAKLAMGILGNTVLLNGFECTPNSPANLNVQIGPGELYQMAQVDTTPYGDLPVDTHQIFKQGINMDAWPANTLVFTVPATPGQSVNYLIEFALEEDDINEENRNFYGAAPQLVPTLRQDSVIVKALEGTPATTGDQVTPAPEAGFTGGWVITIANGQTTITADDIAVYPGAPFITEKLKDKISLATAEAYFLTQTQGDARYLKKPSLQQANYYFRAEIMFPQLLTTTEVVEYNYARFNPAGWYMIGDFKLQPTIPCVMYLSASLGLNSATAPGSLTLTIAKNTVDNPENVGDQVDYETTTPTIQTAGVFTFNGTTDFVQVFVLGSGYTRPDFRSVFDGFVIAN